MRHREFAPDGVLKSWEIFRAFRRAIIILVGTVARQQAYKNIVLHVSSLCLSLFLVVCSSLLEEKTKGGSGDWIGSTCLAFQFSHHMDMHEYVVFELNDSYGSDHLNDSYGSDHWIEAKIICLSACTLRHIFWLHPNAV